MDFDTAWNCISWWTILLDRKPPSANKRVHAEPLNEGSQLEWWLAHDGRDPDWRNGRTVAYLCAYLDIGRGRIAMRGIGVEGGYLYPDRAVMRSLYAAGCLVVDGDSFALTERGEALVAPFIKLQQGVPSITFHSYKGRDH